MVKAFILPACYQLNRLDIASSLTIGLLALLHRELGLLNLNRAVRQKDYRAVDERQFASPTHGLENDPDG